LPFKTLLFIEKKKKLYQQCEGRPHLIKFFSPWALPIFEKKKKKKTTDFGEECKINSSCSPFYGIILV